MILNFEYIYNKDDKIILVNVKNFNSYDVRSYNYIYQANYLKKEKYFSYLLVKLICTILLLILLSSI
jgi:translation elongation factor P/translation initiation factor 5A